MGNNYTGALELQKQGSDLAGKLSFMLITASAASIGYILTQLEGRWDLILLIPLLSLILLGVSFMFGCAVINKLSEQFNFNSRILQHTNNKDFNEALQIIPELEKTIDKVIKNKRHQYLTFILGVISYATYVFLKLLIGQ